MRASIGGFVFFLNVECTIFHNEASKNRRPRLYRRPLNRGPQIRMARRSCSDYVGVDAGMLTPPFIRYHSKYIYYVQSCAVSSFDAWITFFQMLEAVMCYGTKDRFIFQTNTFKKRHQETLFFI